MVELSRDAIFEGHLTLWQPARGQGYRFNLDPVLLAGFAGKAGHVVELGAGCGVLGLALLAAGKAERLTAVEIQPALAELARRNAADNGFAARVTVICSDLRELSSVRGDHVVFNPPYFKAGTGRGAPNDSRDTARHERNGGLADFVNKAFELAPMLSAIVPIARADELAAAVTRVGAITRRREVRPRAGEPPNHVLIEGRLQAMADIVVEPPVIVHREGERDYTDEVAAWLRGEL